MIQKTILLLETPVKFDFDAKQNYCERRIHLYNGRIVRLQLWGALDNTEYSLRFTCGYSVLSSWCSPSLFSESVDVSWPIPGFGGNELILAINRKTYHAVEHLDIKFIIWHEIEREI